jgi:hypothetical protein
MEQALGVKLLNEGKKGSIEFLKAEDFIAPPSFAKKLISENGPIRMLNRARVNMGRSVRKKFKMRVRKIDKS